MTYEDLIVAIDDAAPRLSEASLRLLLRLVSLAIQTGSGTIHMSHRKLGELLGMSREGIARATRGLAHLILIESGGTVTSKFVLPADWFTPQPTLFPVPAGQLSRPPGQLARPPLANEPGQIWPTNQATTGQRSRPPGQLARPPLANEVGHLANLPGQTGQRSRPVLTENQQLTDSALIRSDQDLILGASSVISQISQIAEIRELREEQKEVASLLSLDLQGYMKLHHPPGGCEEFPPSLVLARCLAIAEHETLAQTLTALHNEGRQAGRKYAWFVAVFLNRIHGIDPEIVAEAFADARTKKKAQPPETPLFPDDLVQQTAAKMRKLG